MNKIVPFRPTKFCLQLIKPCSYIGLWLSLFFVFSAQAATYSLTSGSYPPCNTSWSVSGTTYTCTGNGRVTLASGDILTANTAINIVANNGFSLNNNTLGSVSANINLTSSYGTIVSVGTNTLYGFLQGGSGAITLVGSTVSGAITSSANINLTGGGVAGLVTSTSNTITTNNTNLSGGARAQSGMNISGGVLAGAFTMTSNNPATFTSVIMTSGSISGASTVSITGSKLGSSSSAVSVTSTSGAVSLSSTTVYGNLTAPNYSTVNVASGSLVAGNCVPNSTPANSCNAVPACTTGLVGGLAGNYFSNMTLAGSPAGTRIDSSVNFDWGTGSAGVSGIGADSFSVRWNGSLRAPTTGAYQFQTESDDGVRLWVNNVLVIDNWGDHAVTTNNSSSVNLVAGQSYPVRLEFYENGGSAVMKLNWSQPTNSAFTA
ncbi:MAG TPA: PA14 domain-containing protein, partial [Cellvibrio sp.]|nr:PA14 domain-containing protein [Cellvibrio sp.]